MNTRLLRTTHFLALALGFGAAASNWLWAKGFISLWILLCGLAYLPATPFRISLQHVLAFLAFSSAIWGVGLLIGTILPGFFLILLWLGFAAYSIFLWKQDRAANNPPDPVWPPRFQAVLFAWLFGGGTLLSLWLFSLIYHCPRPPYWGYSLTWAVLGFVAAYPSSIRQDFTAEEKWSWKKAAPFFIAGVLIVHAARGAWIQSTINQDKPTQISPGAVAEDALRHGYLRLAAEGVLKETNRLFLEKGATEAINYHRSVWRDIDKERLARAFQRRADVQQNLFLFTSCYGCSLALKPSEQAVDFAVAPEKNAFFLITSQGRLLRLGTKGVELIYQGKENPVALAYSLQSGAIAILNASGFVEIIERGKAPVSFDLPPNRVWKDVAIHPNGFPLWTMDGTGRIDSYAPDVNSQFWHFEKELQPSLWQESDVAQAFYPAGRENAFYILDRANGVHWQGDQPLPEKSPLSNALLLHYNPNRQAAQNLGYWPPLSSLLLLERSGRIPLIATPDFSHSSASLAELSSATPVSRAPVDSLLFFDPSQSTWQRKLESVALAAYPEINTLYELQRNGALQAIAMPQRFHIRFIHPERYRIPTDVPLSSY